MKGRVARWVLAALLAGNLCPAADLYRVAGAVVESETGKPLMGARVFLRPDGSSTAASTLVTGPDGRFSFDVPQGTYHLNAGRRDSIQVYGNRRPDVAFGSSIIAGPGQNTSNLVFRWFPRSAITGRVTDDTNEPVESALVQLIGSRTVAGRRVNSTIAWERTDDRGEYRFWNLTGGTYYLAVTAEPWYQERFRAQHSPPAISASYMPVYYPNTADASRAAPLNVKPGEEAHANFSLRTVPGSTIIVTFDEEHRLTGLISLVREGGLVGANEFQRQARAASSEQVLRGIPPGRYLLRVTGTMSQGPVVARQWVDVNGVDLHLKPDLHPAVAVSGTFQWKNPEKKPRGTVLAMLFPEQPGATGNAMAASIKADGSFVFPAFMAGRYRPEIRVGSTYFSAEFHVEGAEFRNGLVNLAEDEAVTMRIVADGETGTLKGFVSRGEQAADGVMVALAPVEDTNHWLAYHGYQTDSDGSFSFEAMPVGEYFLFAVDDMNLEYTNPASNHAYYPKARRVRIEAGQTIKEKIGVLERIERP